MSKIKITFQPSGKSVLIPKGISIKDAAKIVDIIIDSPCGGIGKCGKCKVKVIKGTTKPSSFEKKCISNEDIKNGIRLACQTKVSEEMIVTIPDKLDVDLKKMLLSEVKSVKSQKYSDKFGVAIDIGTTTIVGILVDLTTNDTISVAAKDNPQYEHGADVISRINYSINNQNGTKKLQNYIVTAINSIIKRFVKNTGIHSGQIRKMTIAGNTTMQHLFMGINPEKLAIAPYKPTVKGLYDSVNSFEIGIDIDKNAEIYIIPNISGWIGGDTLSMIFALGFDKSDKIKLAIDIGTNGEIVLGSKERILVTSTAAGPCFEGVNISCGMRASKGAIESVYFTDEGVYCNVIGNVTAKGLCGSGMIDAMAELLKYKIIDDTGRFRNYKELKKELSPVLLDSVIEDNKRIKFLVYKNSAHNIFITQQDIREFQLAKAAICAGIKLLVNELGITVEDIDEVLLAGTFGNYIDKSNAQKVGLIPSVSLEKVKYVGNAACDGARLALVSQKVRNEMEENIKTIEHINLISQKDFQKTFVGAMNFPRI
ncbi:MAG: hypothetical protein A2474_01745 [Elusimicrobia bacterium RIFOXYC2_FULL_34_12]|nr:MAG: hypothetical protein A2474_01745 [Elusimicrobia bacterium RIFOXYC2_FULL_34_12]